MSAATRGSCCQHSAPPSSSIGARCRACTSSSVAMASRRSVVPSSRRRESREPGGQHLVIHVTASARYDNGVITTRVGPADRAPLSRARQLVERPRHLLEQVPGEEAEPPCRAASASPHRAWTCTPHRTAPSGSAPRATSAATMPARTSPDPDVPERGVTGALDEEPASGAPIHVVEPRTATGLWKQRDRLPHGSSGIVLDDGTRHRRSSAASPTLGRRTARPSRAGRPTRVVRRPPATPPRRDRALCARRGAARPARPAIRPARDRDTRCRPPRRPPPRCWPPAPGRSTSGPTGSADTRSSGLATAMGTVTSGSVITCARPAPARSAATAASTTPPGVSASPPITTT